MVGAISIAEMASTALHKRPTRTWLRPFDAGLITALYIPLLNRVAALFNTLLKVLSTAPTMTAAKNPVIAEGKTVFTSMGYACK